MSNDSINDDLIPAGRYIVKAIDHAFGKAGTGTEQIGVTLQILEGPYAGQLLNWYGAFTEKSEEFTIKGMRALGWQGVDINHMETMYTGKASAVVDHDPDRDDPKRMRAKVNWINPIGVVMKERMEGADLAKFGQRIKGAAAKIGNTAQPTNLGAPAQNRGGGKSGGQAGPGRFDDAPPPEDDGPWNRR